MDSASMVDESRACPSGASPSKIKFRGEICLHFRED
jgi:hypothetical protein